MPATFSETGMLRLDQAAACPSKCAMSASELPESSLSLLNFALVTKLQQWMTYFTQECCRSCKPLETERYRLPVGCIVYT
jgi:hypothetical protein